MRLPIWWDSIRAIIALLLVFTVCCAVFIPSKFVTDKELDVLKDLAMLAITFYFTLKHRPEEANKPEQKKENE